MNQGKLIFKQITEQIHREQFKRCAEKYPMKRVSKTFNAWDQFLCMAFAQITYRESLRDIETCLRSQSNLLYAMGICGNVARSNLAYANENRNWRVFAELAQQLIKKARELYSDEVLDFDVEEMVYALDATTIDLCLSLFPWADFRSTKAAIKMHTLIDLRGSIPCFIDITEGSIHDVNVLDKMPIEPGSIYTMDRGYIDFKRLYKLSQQGGFFVTRSKRNCRFYVMESRKVDKTTGLRCDQTIRLKTKKSKKDYPVPLRRIRFYDKDNKKSLVFLTNHFTLPALTVCKTYKGRWQIELFFKWIKQNLRVKTFYGTSINAVKSQIWIAVCVYTLVAILKKQNNLSESLYTLLQILSINVFSKETVGELLAKSRNEISEDQDSNQLMFKLL